MMAQFLTTASSIHTSNRSILSPHSPKFLAVAGGRCRNSTPIQKRSSFVANPCANGVLRSKRRSQSIVRLAANTDVSRDGNVVEVEDGETMEKCIKDAGDKLVVVGVSTTTCGPCKIIYPKMVKMSTEYTDVLFYKINGDRSKSTRALMKKWEIRAVPSFRFYRNGELIHSHSGANEDDLRAFFLAHYFSAEKVA